MISGAPQPRNDGLTESQTTVLLLERVELGKPRARRTRGLGIARLDCREVHRLGLDGGESARINPNRMELAACALCPSGLVETPYYIRARLRAHQSRCGSGAARHLAQAQDRAAPSAYRPPTGCQPRRPAARRAPPAATMVAVNRLKTTADGAYPPRHLRLEAGHVSAAGVPLSQKALLLPEQDRVRCHVGGGPNAGDLHIKRGQPRRVADRALRWGARPGAIETRRNGLRYSRSLACRYRTGRCDRTGMHSPE